MYAEVDRQVAQALKAFGALRRAVFLNKNLSLSREGHIMLASCLRCYTVQNAAVCCDTTDS